MVRSIFAVAALLAGGLSANAADVQQMTPQGTRCAAIGEFCSFSGTMAVRVAGCKSVDKYNGGCGSSKSVVATNGINCKLATFDLKAPLPDVGPNACYYQTLADAGMETASRKPGAVPSERRVNGAQCASTGVVTVDTPIVVNATTHDGQCKTYVAGSGLKRSGSETTDKPMFRLEGGATLKNVIVGERLGGDGGIVVSGNAVLENIRWMKLRENAVFIRGNGTVSFNKISAEGNAASLVQADNPATVRIQDCTAENLHSLVAQKPATTFKLQVIADRCQFTNVADGIFVTESKTSEAKLSNSNFIKTDTICKGTWQSCGDVGNAFY